MFTYCTYTSTGPFGKTKLPFFTFTQLNRHRVPSPLAAMYSSLRGRLLRRRRDLTKVQSRPQLLSTHTREIKFLFWLKNVASSSLLLLSIQMVFTMTSHNEKKGIF